MTIEQTMRLVQQLRQARKAKGWSQAQLAQEAGLAPNTVMRLESGQKVRPGSLTAAMAALGVEHIADMDLERSDLSDAQQLVLEITEQWIKALPPAEVDQAARDLTRWIMSRMT